MLTLTPLLARYRRRLNRAATTPASPAMLEPLEGRMLFTVFSNADLAGLVTIGGLHYAGNYNFDPQSDIPDIGSVSDGAFIEDRYSTTQVNSGYYFVTESGIFSIFDLDTTNPNFEPEFIGFLSSTKDTGLLVPSDLPTGDGSDINFAVLASNSLDNNSVANLNGDWFLAGYDASGSISFNGSGVITDGFTTDIDGNFVNILGGNATVASDGTVTVAALTDDTFQTTIDLAGTINTSHDVIVLNNYNTANAPQFDADLNVLVRTGGSYSNSSITDVWNLVAPNAWGTVVLAPDGTLNGSLTNDDNSSSIITGTYILSSDGSISFALEIDQAFELAYDGVVNASQNFIAASDQTVIDSEPGSQTQLFFVRSQAGDDSISGPSLDAYFGLITLGSTPLYQTTVLPGDKLTVPLTVFNAGDTAAAGNIQINFYVSTTLEFDPSSDTLISSNAISNFNLAASDSRELKYTLTIPTSTPVDDYYIYAVVDPLNATGGGGADNIIHAAQPISVDYTLGNVGNRGNIALTIPIPGGATATFKLKGAGSADLTPNEDGSFDIVFSNTVDASALTITTSKGTDGTVQPLVIRNLTIGSEGGPSPSPFKLLDTNALPGGGAPDTSALGKLIAKTTRLIGTLDAPNGIGAVTLDSIDSGASINIGGGTSPSTPVTLVFNLVENAQLTSERPIKSLTVTKWTDDIGTSSITAPSIGALVVKGNSKFGIAGDFEANLTLTENSDKTLGSAKIAGALSDANWQITGTVGAIAVTGNTNDFTADISNSMKSLKATTITDAEITVTGDAGSIAANSWLDGALTTNTAKSIAIKGDIGAELFFNGTDGVPAISSIKISGNITGNTWTIPGLVKSISAASTSADWTLRSGGTGLNVTSLKTTGDLGGTFTLDALGKVAVGGSVLPGTVMRLFRAYDAGNPKLFSLTSLAVKGTITALAVRTTGGIGSISASTISDSNITAGLPLDFTGLPNALASFTFPAAPLNSTKFTAFSNTRIAAGIIGSLALGVVDTTNGSTILGIAADTIGKLSATGSAGAIALPADGAATTDGDFTVRVLN